MNFSSIWTRYQRKLATRSSRKTQRAPQIGVEAMEPRELLSASALFLPASGELSLDLDSSESVRISSVGGNVVVEASTDGGTTYSTINSIGPVLASSIVSINVLGGDDANTIDLSGVLAADFTSLTSIVVDGANGDDLLIGSPDFGDSLIGGNGEDTILGQGGNDTLVGGDGDDSIDAGTGSDSVNAGDGDDSVLGNDGDDTILAGNGQDTVSGGDGDDSISGANGQDSLLGDAGDDTINGDGGVDTVDGGIGNDSILGGELNDSLLGGDGNDTINGQGGNDSIDGGAGDDSLLGAAGNDTISGNDGNDVLNGGAGTDLMFGNSGNDTLLGGAGNDSLFGDGPDANSQQTGNDSINGQAGNDTIIGGRGNDTLNGGAGDDLVRSFFEATEVTVTPPPQPPVQPPQPTLSGGAFPDAVDSGAGALVGAENTMSTGVGDGSLIVAIDATGRFGTASGLLSPFNESGATYDPIGPILPATSTFESYLFFRTGINGTGVRDQVDQVATNISQIRGTGNESNSTFVIGNLGFALTQNTVPTTGSTGLQNGSLLTQTYRITNNNAVAESFELVRYIDGDLQFDGTIADGGGRLVTSAGDELLFETDAGGGGATATTFLGITGRGGTAPATNRFEVDSFSGLRQQIGAGTALDDMIVGDLDGDGFIENGQEYDVTLGFRNEFTIAPGQTVIYTTHTIFGSGAPSAIVPPNTLPVANPNTGTSVLGQPVTIDVVSDDTDADGVLIFSTLAIATPPANGTAVSLGNGLITYTPNPGFNGTDTFTYTIQDDRGGVSNAATVTITVIGAEADGDLIFGGDGNDTLVGSEGNDTINGQAGNDSILGGGGNDSLVGGAGNDTLDGQAGDDTLDGQGGDDSLIGGDGNDVIVLGNGAGGTDTADGGDGFNQIVVNGTNSADTFVVGQNAGRITVTRGLATIIAASNMSVQGVTVNGLGGDDTVTIQDLSAVDCPALVVINGGDGNDLITGQGSNLGVVRLALNGNNGNDTIIGTNGNDSIDGGAGNDAVNGQAGNDFINGGDGDDILAGGLGNDTVNGGNGNDFITGQAGDDSLTGNAGNDTIRGFEGNDTLVGLAGDDLLNGMDGNDSILGGVGKDSITGGAGNDTLDGGRNDDQINGNSGADLIRGDHGNDYIHAGTESDTVNGGDGNDTIIATDGGDFLAGGDGNDQINAGGGDDVLSGGDGNDTLLGGSGNDIILGGDGDDVINGQGGTDIISGGQGTDIIADPASEIDELFTLSAAILTLLEAA